MWLNLFYGQINSWLKSYSIKLYFFSSLLIGGLWFINPRDSTGQNLSMGAWHEGKNVTQKDLRKKFLI